MWFIYAVTAKRFTAHNWWYFTGAGAGIDVCTQLLKTSGESGVQKVWCFKNWDTWSQHKFNLSFILSKELEEFLTCGSWYGL
jgi:hypothetical protein